MSAAIALAALGMLLARFLLAGPRFAGFLARRISSAIDGSVTIDDARYVPLRGFEASGIRVVTRDGTDVLHVEQLSLRLGVLALLRRELRLEVLEVRGPRVVVYARSGADVDSVVPESESSAWRFSIGSLSVRDARIVDDTAELGPLMIEARDFVYAPPGTLDLGWARIGDDRSWAYGYGHLDGAGVRGRVQVDLSLTDPLVRQILPGEALSFVQAGDLRASLERDELEMRGNVDLVDARVADIPIDSASASFRYADERVTIEALEARSFGGVVHAGGELSLRGGHALELELEDLPAARLFSVTGGDAHFVPDLLSGRVTLVGEQPPWRRSLVTLTVVAPRPPDVLAEYLDAPLRLAGNLRLTPSGASDVELEASSGALGATVTGSATVAALHLQLTAHHGDPSRLRGLMNLPVRVTDADLAATITGAPTRPNASGTLTARGVDDSGGHWRLHAPFDASLERVLVREATLAPPEGEVHFGGELSFARGLRGRASLAANGLSLGRLSGHLLQGTLALEAEGGLALGRHTVRVRARADALALKDAALGAGTAVVTWADHRVLVQQLALSLSGGGSASGSGAVNVDGSDLAATVDLKAVDLSPFASVLGRPIVGQANGTLRLEGNVRAPSGAAEVRLHGLKLGALSAGDIDLTAHSVAGEIAFRLAARHGAALALDAAGEYRLASQELRATAQGTIGQLSAWAATFGVATEVDGSATFEGVVDGRLPYPRSAHASVRSDDLTLAGARLPDVVLADVSSSSQGYVFEAAMGHLLRLAGEWRASSKTLDVAAEASHLELQDLVPALGGAGLAVRVSGRVHGSYRSRAAFDGTAELSELVARTPSARLENDGPVELVARGSSVEIARLILRGDRGASFRATGLLGNALDVRVSGTVDAGFVAPFVPALAYAAGALAVDAHFSGLLARPEVVGHVVLVTPVVIRARALPREARLTRGRIVASSHGTALHITTDLVGEIGGGAAHLDGEADLSSWSVQHYEARLRAQRLPLRTQSLLVDADVDVTLRGDAARATLAGRIDIARGRYTRKFELREFNFIAKKPEVEPSLEQTSPWLDTIALDLRAVSAGAVEVKVDAGVFGLNALLDTDLQVTGSALRPRVAGRIAASQGEVTFPEAKLDVTRAVIELVPSARPETVGQIDLVAEGEVTPPGGGAEVSAPSYLVQLSLVGTLERMQLELTSDPALSRLEVLALLVSGQVAGIAGGRGISRAGSLDAALAFAGSQLAEPLSQLVERELERALNLRLELGAELTTEGLRVTARKELSSRLALEGAYERAIGNSLTIASARARLFVTDRLFLEGTTASTSGIVLDPTIEPNQTRVELKLRLHGP